MLARSFVTLTGARTEIPFRVPRGATYYLHSFMAVWPLTVVANAETSARLSFELFIEDSEVTSDQVPLVSFTSPTIFKQLDRPHALDYVVKAQSLIRVVVRQLGAGVIPATISLTFFGRAGWEIK